MDWNSQLKKQIMLMKKTRFGLLVCTFTLLLGLPASAQNKPKDKAVRPMVSEKKAGAKSLERSTVAPTQEPLLGVKVIISPEEREVIQNYVTVRTTPTKPGKKPKGLPPGLAKKLERGGKLPPGWEKKCVPGAIMPPEIYQECKRLPQAIVVKLPPPPPGTILVAIEGKVARLMKATHEILDVFDLLVPPLPRLP
jgi:hypothetical protein